METESRKPVMIENYVEGEDKKHRKLIFMAKVSGTGKYVEFSLDCNKTYIYRKRFVIAQGCKLTCGDKSYVVSAVASMRFGPVEVYAREVTPDKHDIEELEALSSRLG